MSLTTPSHIVLGPDGASTLRLDDMAVVGRGLIEYRMMFNLDETTLLSPAKQNHIRVLDAAAATASFRAVLSQLAAENECQVDVIAADAIYDLPSEHIFDIAMAAVEHIMAPLLQVDSWTKHAWVSPYMPFARPADLLEERRRIYAQWLTDFNTNRSRYVTMRLPCVCPLQDQRFDLILCGNCLFAYAGSQFGATAAEVYAFHRDSFAGFGRFARAARGVARVPHRHGIDAGVRRNYSAIE